MSVKKGKGPVFDPGFCRCCGGMRKCRVLNVEYESSGQTEIYCDMIKDCFGLLLAHLDGKPTERLICATCVQRLREAYNFRQQVLRCEKIFIQMTRDANAGASSEPGAEDILKTEIEVEVEPMERDHSPCRDALADDASDCRQIVTTKMLQKLFEDTEYDVNAINESNHYVTEDMGILLNALTVLQYSNATPFKSKTQSGLTCYYCRNIFENLDKLKDHQSTQHRRTELKKILSRYEAECLVVYADVTDLKCTICNESIPKLNDLKSHLIKKHNKTIYTEFNDRVIPLKLTTTNVYECQICGINIETFGSIQNHMNVHFRNYVCNECGTGFVTKYRLKIHYKSVHIEGSFPCEICKKVFTAQKKLKNHVDIVHKALKRFKCPKCPERFKEYVRRHKHMVEVHGVAPLQYKCNVCDKSFNRRYILSCHMKRDHLEERNFQCQICPYKCLTSTELRFHMIKHSGERVHECSVCKKSYARKKTLVEHMRIHNNDRRFVCTVCGQAFVQNCSLKGHIKTHHSK